MGSIDRNRSEREEACESLVVAQNKYQATIEERLGDIDHQWKAMDQRCQTLLTDSRDAEMRYRKLFEEQVGTAIRETRKESQDSIAEELATRVASEKHLLDQLDWIGEQ